jgi:hypothetical protein
MHMLEMSTLLADCFFKSPSSPATAGADDFCKVEGMAGNTDVAVKVVYIEAFNKQAVKEALVGYGPVSVGVDASPIPFRCFH